MDPLTAYAIVSLATLAMMFGLFAYLVICGWR